MAEHISVFYEGQDDLVDILTVSLVSVCENTNSSVDFYILDCGICPLNKKLITKTLAKYKNARLEFMPVDLHRFDGMKGWPPPKYQFLDCYARLLIPELRPELARAVYLDSDVIALDDIRLLWEQNLEGYALGAVADAGYEKGFYKNCVENLGVSPDHVYMNAGVLLMDCEQWRKKGICEELLRIGREKKEHLLVLNEDILSVYFNHTAYKLLDSRFNISDLNSRICNYSAPQINDEYLLGEWKTPVIYHFCHGKPFRQIKNTYDGRVLRHFDTFWYFAEKTPFYPGLSLRFSSGNELHKGTTKEVLSLFGIPLLGIRIKNGTSRYKLFNLIPFMKKKVK